MIPDISWADYGTYDESAYPELWDRCIGAWNPSLGYTGQYYDHSYRKYHITAPSWTTYKGKVCCFQNANSIISGFWNTNELPLTLSVWSVNAGHGIVLSLRATDSDSNTIEIVNRNGLFQFGQYSFPGGWPIKISYDSYPINLHHLLLTYDGTTLKGYVNGLRVGECPFSPSLASCSLGIGCRPAGTAFSDSSCQLSSPMIWNRLLSQAEILLLARHPNIAYMPRRGAYRFAFGNISAGVTLPRITDYYRRLRS